MGRDSKAIRGGGGDERLSGGNRKGDYDGGP